MARSAARFLACWLIATALAAGCRPAPAPPAPPPPSGRIDPCAERLHDICGQLLLHYVAHRRLPETLDALAAGEVLQPPPPVCPASGKPYLYDSRGLAIAGRQGRLVLYDPEPSHSGMRWGIIVMGPSGAGAITTDVILVSEEAIAAAGKR